MFVRLRTFGLFDKIVICTWYYQQPFQISIHVYKVLNIGRNHTWLHLNLLFSKKSIESEMTHPLHPLILSNDSFLGNPIKYLRSYFFLHTFVLVHKWRDIFKTYHIIIISWLADWGENNSQNKSVLFITHFTSKSMPICL